MKVENYPVDVVEAPTHELSRDSTYVKVLLSIIAGLLWFGVWIIIFFSDCSVGSFLGDIESKLAAFIFSTLFHMPFVSYVVTQNQMVVISPGVKILLRSFCAVFSLCCWDIFKDVPSLLIGFLLSLYTIPVCKLLHLVDDVGFLESSVGMSVAAIRSLRGVDTPEGWIAVLFYITALLFTKLEIATWYEKREKEKRFLEKK